MESTMEQDTSTEQSTRSSDFSPTQKPRYDDPVDQRKQLTERSHGTRYSLIYLRGDLRHSAPFIFLSHKHSYHAAHTRCSFVKNLLFPRRAAMHS